MRFDEVGTPLKHPETINDNIKNLSKKCLKNSGSVFPRNTPRVHFWIATS
jgi:hypothetical protein